MPLYRAEVYTSKGERKLLRREASGENELLRDLAAQGCTVVGVREEKTDARPFVSMPLQNWKAALNQMYLIYGGRFEL